MLSQFFKTISAATVIAVSATTLYADNKMKVVTTFTVLADMAMNHPEVFTSIVNKVK